MQGRLNQNDVSNRVNVEDPLRVRDAVLGLFAARYPGSDFTPLACAFDDFKASPPGSADTTRLYDGFESAQLDTTKWSRTIITGTQDTSLPTPQENGGFKIYDVSNRAKPKLLAHHRTYGRGVHRFDMDEKYAYISTEMEGYVGNILVIYDLRNPAKPEEVSRWWMPGQHTAGGEKPTWQGRRNRLHHALRFGDELWAGCWHGGVAVIDVSNIRKPRTLGAYNYHPPFPEPSHTFMPVPKPIGGRRIAVAIDEEDHAHSADEMERRKGRPHGCLWVFDVSDLKNIKPLSIFEVSELDSPWSRAAPGRFGAHQFQEHMDGTLVYCTWFSGGLRIVDVADPSAPQEVGHFIPEPAAGKVAPQSNDVDVDRNGLIYLGDRYAGLDILEFTRP